MAKSRERAWLRDELILALDLYLSEGPNGTSETVATLSNTLRAFPIESDLAIDPTFRSAASVKRKLANFRALDPNVSGGLEHGSKGDADAWAEFASDPNRLRRVAAAIRTVIASASVASELADIGEEDDDFVEAEEGALLTRSHRTRERSRKLVAKKKAGALKTHGHLRCEVCSFDFSAVYGELGKSFIECHHALPVSQLSPGAKTRLEDLALVCANCHRMLHHKQPWPTMTQLRAILRKS